MISSPFSRQHTLMIAVLVTLLFMIGIFTSDIYVPALPVMAKDLQASQFIMEISVALYFLSFSFSQLFYGPLADHFGRKPIIMVGLFIAFIGTVICTFANNGEILVIGRLIQAAGMGAPMTLGRVVLRDLFTGIELARWNSYTGAFLLLAPALAPILGGYLANEWNWQAIFIFLMLFVFIIITLSGLYLPETRPHPTEPLKLEIVEVFSHYITVLKNKTFLAYASAAGIALTGMVIYLTLSSFLFQEKLGFNIIEYSWMSVFVSAALITGMMVNAWLLYYFNFNKIIAFGLSLKCLSGVLLILSLILGIFNAVSLIISITLFSFACSLVFANASSGAFSVFNHRLGMVGALYGSIQMLLAGLLGTIASIAQNYADWTLGISFVFLGIIGLYIFLRVKVLA